MIEFLFKDLEQGAYIYHVSCEGKEGTPSACAKPTKDIATWSISLLARPTSIVSHLKIGKKN
jgi:hypothetical protein